MVGATSSTPYARISAAQQGHIAYMRFGLGPKPSANPDQSGNNPSDLSYWTTNGAAYSALKRELNYPRAVIVPEIPLGRTVINPNGVPTTEDCAAAVVAASVSGSGDMSSGLPARDGDLRARFRMAQRPTIGFVERLVLFWSNHFNVMWNKGLTTHHYTGHLERTIIRPNVLGSFASMLKGVIKHPAMLTYLDNNANIGPNSQYSGHVGKFLNENLAREVLELHTVGNCYSQADVMNLAAILTGFRVSMTTGRFEYDNTSHEPGTFTVFGRPYPQTYNTNVRAQQTWSNMTPDQLDRVLEDLAVRPETGRQLAKKMIRHFITDDPPDDAVNALADAFGPTGDLRAMAEKLLDLNIGWAPASEIPYRLRTPQLSVIAMNRALLLTDDDVNRTLGQRFWFLGPLNHNVWEHAAPDGYSDYEATWVNEGSFRARMELTYTYVRGIMANRHAPIGETAGELAEKLFPGFLSQQTRDVIANSQRPRDFNLEATLLFLSVEFLHR